MELTPLFLLTVLIVAFFAGFGWTIGCYIASALIGALRGNRSATPPQNRS